MISILNIIYGYGAIYRLGWHVSITIHGIAGTMFTILMTISALVGVLSHYYLRFGI
jgi:hypothetical protein